MASSSLPERALPALPVDYYLTNFQRLLDGVMALYTDLLTADERDWITRFQSNAPAAQCLAVRMMMRKGQWFRLDKLVYEEIPDVADAALQLQQRGLVEIVSEPDKEVLLSLLTKPELCALYSHLELAKSASRADWERAIIADPAPAPAHSYQVLHFAGKQYLPVWLLLYFGNSHQDLSQFVLSDLGLEQFESYRLDSETRLFQHRDHIEAWLQLSDLAQIEFELAEQKRVPLTFALLEQLTEPYDWPPLERKRQRLINRIARNLERSGDIQQALHWFSQTQRSPSQERQVRMLLSEYKKAQEPALLRQAEQLIFAMSNASFNHEEWLVAQTLRKQYRRANGERVPREKPPILPQEHLALPQRDKRVEADVLTYFEAQGWRGWHSENVLLNALFGLAFWDVIFSSQPGAFLNPYQRAPRDMYTSDFTEKRRDLINQRFAELNQNTDSLLACFDEKHGIANDWVIWKAIDREMIATALAVFPTNALVACFSRLLSDLRYFRAGMPDLFLEKDGEWRWVEVKGPGDKLQTHQIEWLTWLEQQHLPVSVLYVTYSDV
uniref:VRR-NUC domain-containing protein n=1 Tax=Thaumasiovibrio occultus TaxID=1891184 RepID=UPI000B3618FA|nr:VRR-NUC domain-containing protein [Thaumasiovibrio occultus]